MGGTRAFVLILTLGVCQIGTSRVTAGLYNPAEAPLFAPGAEKPFEMFRDQLIPLRPIGVVIAPGQPGGGSGFGKPGQLAKAADKPSSPIAMRYALMSLLAGNRVPTNLKTEELLCLGDYLIRSKKYAEAAALLDGAYRKNQNREGVFLLLSTLATAQQMEAQMQNERVLFRRAETNFAEARKKWPKKMSDLPESFRKFLKTELRWDDELLEWFRVAEAYQEKLTSRRAGEPPLKPGLFRPLRDDVDALFETKEGKPVRFVGPSGKYEAGRIADDLPPDAIKIVQQLILWMPEDFRLYWLLAELYNARGEYATALTIFDLIRTSLPPMPELAYPKAFLEHEAILRTARREAEKKAAAELLNGAKQQPDQPPGGEPKQAAADPAGATPPPLPFDWRSLGVGILIGIVIGLLGYWQVREIGRRRANRRPLAA